MTSPSAKMLLVASLVAAIVVTNTDDIGVEAGRHHLEGGNKSNNFTNSNRFLSHENGNMLLDESILRVSQTQNDETLRDLKSSKDRKSNKESKKQEKGVRPITFAVFPEGWALPDPGRGTPRCLSGSCVCCPV